MDYDKIWGKYSNAAQLDPSVEDTLKVICTQLQNISEVDKFLNNLEKKPC